MDIQNIARSFPQSHFPCCRQVDWVQQMLDPCFFHAWLKETKIRGHRLKHYFKTLSCELAMQFFRAFAAICLAWTAPLFLQGCSSDSDDLVTSDSDANTTTVTATVTVTTTVTSTATTTVTTVAS